ncbi:hypothetical protein VTO42DRAFT_4707 [Malbranchea cinnamomea]
MVPAETHYPTHDKEMPAITDTPIEVSLITRQSPNSRQTNWAETLAQFKFLIKYRPGRVNRLADALSRREDMVKASRPYGTNSASKSYFLGA